MTRLGETRSDQRQSRIRIYWLPGLLVAALIWTPVWAVRRIRSANAAGHSSGKYVAALLAWVCVLAGAVISLAVGESIGHPSAARTTPHAIIDTNPNHLALAGPNTPADRSACPLQLPAYATADNLSQAQATALVRTELAMRHYGIEHRNLQCLSMSGGSVDARYKAMGTAPMTITQLKVTFAPAIGASPSNWRVSVTVQMTPLQPLMSDADIEPTVNGFLGQGLDPTNPSLWQLSA